MSLLGNDIMNSSISGGWLPRATHAACSNPHLNCQLPRAPQSSVSRRTAGVHPHAGSQPAARLGRSVRLVCQSLLLKDEEPPGGEGWTTGVTYIYIWNFVRIYTAFCQFFLLLEATLYPNIRFLLWVVVLIILRSDCEAWLNSGSIKPH